MFWKRFVHIYERILYEGKHILQKCQRISTSIRNKLKYVRSVYHVLGDIADSFRTRTIEARMLNTSRTREFTKLQRLPEGQEVTAKPRQYICHLFNPSDDYRFWQEGTVNKIFIINNIYWVWVTHQSLRRRKVRFLLFYLF